MIILLKKLQASSQENMKFLSSKSRMAFEASWEIVLKLWPELAVEILVGRVAGWRVNVTICLLIGI